MYIHSSTIQLILYTIHAYMYMKYYKRKLNSVNNYTSTLVILSKYRDLIRKTNGEHDNDKKNNNKSMILTFKL